MRLQTAVPGFVLIVVVFGISAYLMSNPELIELMQGVSIKMVVVLIFLRVLFLALNGLFLKLYATKLGVGLQLAEWVGLPFITTMGNYLTPFSGGMFARAAYLKKRHGLSFTHFGALLVANSLFNFWVAALFGIILSTYIVKQTQTVWLLLLFFAIVWGGISILLSFPLNRFNWKSRFGRTIKSGIDGWMTIKRDKSLMCFLFVLTTASVSINGYTFWIAYRAMNLTITLETAFLVSLSFVFSVMLNLTPGNFGVREAFVSLTSEIIGAGIGEGLLVALLIRACTLVSAFTLGPLFSFYLTSKLPLLETNTEKEE